MITDPRIGQIRRRLVGIELHVEADPRPEGQWVEDVPAEVGHEAAVPRAVVSRLAAVGKMENGKGGEIRVSDFKKNEWEHIIKIYEERGCP